MESQCQSPERRIINSFINGLQQVRIETREKTPALFKLDQLIILSEFTVNSLRSKSWKSLITRHTSSAQQRTNLQEKFPQNYSIFFPVHFSKNFLRSKQFVSNLEGGKGSPGDRSNSSFVNFFSDAHLIGQLANWIINQIFEAGQQNILRADIKLIHFRLGCQHSGVAVSASAPIALVPSSIPTRCDLLDVIFPYCFQSSTMIHRSSNYDELANLC